MFNAVVGGLRDAQVEGFQAAEAGDDLHSDIGDIGPAQIEPAEVLPISKIGESEVCDVFRGVQVHPLDVGERPQAFDSTIGHPHERQIQTSQILGPLIRSRSVSLIHV